MTTRKKVMTESEANDFRQHAARFLEAIEGGKVVWAALVIQTTEGSIKLSSRHSPGSVKLPK